MSSADSVEIVRTEAFHVHNVAILKHDEVWVTFGARWWQFRRWLWWWLTPGLKAWVLVNSHGQGQRIRVRAVLLTRRSVRAGETLP